MAKHAQRGSLPSSEQAILAELNEICQSILVSDQGPGDSRRLSEENASQLEKLGNRCLLLSCLPPDDVHSGCLCSIYLSYIVHDDPMHRMRALDHLLCLLRPNIGTEAQISISLAVFRALHSTLFCHKTNHAIHTLVQSCVLTVLGVLADLYSSSDYQDALEVHANGQDFVPSLLYCLATVQESLVQAAIRADCEEVPVDSKLLQVLEESILAISRITSIGGPGKASFWHASENPWQLTDASPGWVIDQRTGPCTVSSLQALWFAQSLGTAAANRRLGKRPRIVALESALAIANLAPPQHFAELETIYGNMKSCIVLADLFLELPQTAAVTFLLKMSSKLPITLKALTILLVAFLDRLSFGRKGTSALDDVSDEACAQLLGLIKSCEQELGHRAKVHLPLEKAIVPHVVTLLAAAASKDVWEPYLKCAAEHWSKTSRVSPSSRAQESALSLNNTVVSALVGRTVVRENGSQADAQENMLEMNATNLRVIELMQEQQEASMWGMAEQFLSRGDEWQGDLKLCMAALSPHLTLLHAMDTFGVTTRFESSSILQDTLPLLWSHRGGPDALEERELGPKETDTVGVIASITFNMLQNMLEKYSIRAIKTMSRDDYSCPSSCRLLHPKKHASCLSLVLRDFLRLRDIMPPALLAFERLWKRSCPTLFSHRAFQPKAVWQDQPGAHEEKEVQRQAGTASPPARRDEPDKAGVAEDRGQMVLGKPAPGKGKARRRRTPMLIPHRVRCNSGGSTPEPMAERRC